MVECPTELYAHRIQKPLCLDSFTDLFHKVFSPPHPGCPWPNSALTVHKSGLKHRSSIHPFSPPHQNKLQLLRQRINIHNCIQCPALHEKSQVHQMTFYGFIRGSTLISSRDLCNSWMKQFKLGVPTPEKVNC